MLVSKEPRLCLWGQPAFITFSILPWFLLTSSLSLLFFLLLPAHLLHTLWKYHCSQASVIIYIMKILMSVSQFQSSSSSGLYTHYYTFFFFFINKTVSSQTPTSPIELISLSTTHPRAFPGMVTVISGYEKSRTLKFNHSYRLWEGFR